MNKRVTLLVAAIALMVGVQAASASPYVFGFTSNDGSQMLVLDGGDYVFDTSTSQFDPGVDNQGWWSTANANFDENSNYIVGANSGAIYRNFFTFDLTLFEGGATSGYLSLPRGDVNLAHTTGPLPVLYTLWDVTTAADVLNANDGLNAGIYSDLGTGVFYGSVLVSDLLTPDPLIVPLSPAAIAAINAGAGVGYFSIGGALDVEGAPEVPEPGTLLLLGSGLTAFALRRRRQA